MAWLLLFAAGLFEIAWAIGLKKYTEGFTKPWPSALTILAMVVSMFLLAQAVRTIPIGMGYAIWTGIGAAGTAILGMVLFAEPSHLPRLVCLALVIVGILGLKLTAGH